VLVEDVAELEQLMTLAVRDEDRGEDGEVDNNAWVRS
jgi:hypothetical protein